MKTGAILFNDNLRQDRHGVSLCSAHHVFSSDWSAHKTPEKFTRWFKKTYPNRYNAITKKAQKMVSEREAIKSFIDAYPSGLSAVPKALEFSPPA